MTNPSGHPHLKKEAIWFHKIYVEIICAFYLYDPREFRHSVPSHLLSSSHSFRSTQKVPVSSNLYPRGQTHLKLPWVFLQVPGLGHSPCCSRHSFMSVHRSPIWRNPLGQAHSYDPNVFTHSYWQRWLPVEHSSRSRQVLPSLFKTYPWGQEHVKLPQVFVHWCSQGPGLWRHSSTSRQFLFPEAGSGLNPRSQIHLKN